MNLHYTGGSIPLSQFLRLIINGSSEFFSNIAASILSVIINAVLLYLGGTTAVAALSVVMYVDNIVSSLIFGMVSSLQPAVSYCYGAGLVKRVRMLGRYIMAAAASLSIFALLFMRFGGETIIPFFVKPEDHALFEMSLRAIQLYALSYLIGWVDTYMSGLLTALEQPGRSLCVSLFGTLIFPCLCLTVLTSILKLDGVWLMPSAAGLLSAAVSVIAVATIRGKQSNTSRD